MTPELYRKISEVYHAALALEPEQRREFLNQACGDDDELRREVEQLLQSNELAGSFLAQPVVERALEQILEASPGQQEVLIGRDIGQYHVLSKIGAGGMGEVFLAEDLRLSRKVALKLLPAEFGTDSVRVKRFLREAKAAGATAHPNIVSIYDIGKSENIHYIASEFVEGETLRRRIRRSTLPPIEAVEIALQIAGALASAHSAGFIHRDIKPENIMIRPDGFVKVLDFGLAAITKPSFFQSDSQSNDSLTISLDTLPGTIIGTVNYMSPEQVRGQKVDDRSDLWSLGVVLFEMLAGHLPFPGQSVPDTFVAILDRPPLPLNSAPREVQQVITKLLAKEREERYQTAEELASELRALKRQLELLRDNPNHAISLPNHESPNAQASLNSHFSAAQTTSQADPRSSHPGVSYTSQSNALSGERFQPATGKKHRAAFVGLAAILILALAVGAYWMMRGGDSIDSIAIMPLANQTSDASLDYITDGITETLIHNISQLPRLKVTSRTSVFRYKNQRAVDPAELGDKFDVRAILTGRVVKQDQTLVITVELVSTRDGSRLWGNEYRHLISDLLAAQSVISQQVSEQLRSQLSGAEREQISKRFTDNPEAYRLYLNGRFEWNRQSIDSFKKAIEHYKQAIAADNKYALAYAGLADVYGTLAANGLAPSDYARLAKESAERAVALDDQSPEAHHSLGTARYFDWDLPGAEQELRRAISLNANLAEAHSRLSAVLQGMDRYDDAIAAGQRALALDPYSLRVHLDLQFAYFYAGRYDQCVDICRKMMLIESKYFPAHLDLGRAYEQKGMYDEAIAELIKAREFSKDEPLTLAALGHVYAVSGKTADAQSMLNLLLQAAEKGNVRPYEIAKVYAGLGNADQAFEWLEKAFQDHSPWLLKLKSDPNFENLRSDQRFQSLIQRINSPKPR